MPVSKYLQKDAINELTEAAIKNRNGINRVVTHINTGGATTSIATTEVPEITGKPEATIKAATQKQKPAGSGNMVDLETGDFAIDDDGVLYIFIADPALKGTGDASKQWHAPNQGITQAQADARYAQLGVTEFAPKIKLGSGGFTSQLAIADPNFDAMMNGQEFIIDFEDANVTEAAGQDINSNDAESVPIFIVQDIDAIDINTTPMLADISVLPRLKAFDWTDVKASYKTNTFRFKKMVIAPATEATATWKDWTYEFVGLEPKIVPVKHITKQYSNWAEVEADKGEITALMIRPKAQIDHFGAAIRKDAWMPLQPTFEQNNGFTGASSMSNNIEYVTEAKAAGVTLSSQGTQVGTGAAGILAWSKFDIFGVVTVGNALTSAGGSSMLMGQLSDIYDIENGRGVPHAADKVLNIQEIAELVKDQRQIDIDFMATFRDQITYSATKEFTYEDMTRKQATPGGAYSWDKSGLASFKVPVTVNANTLTYDNLISPYNRIKQEQANFTSTFLVNGMSVVYKFFASNKALKFSGDNGETYKWETFGKFENNSRIPYIRFSGTGTMEISNNALIPAYTAQALPYEMKLADLMTNTDAGRVAIVDMEFGSLPGVGTAIMDIDYVTSTLFVENRFKTFLGAINTELKNKEDKTYDYADTARTVTRQTQGANNFLIIDMPTDAPNTPIGSYNTIKLGAMPAGAADGDQVTYGSELIWIVKKDGNIMNYSEVKNEIADGKVMKIKHLANGNWELAGWEDRKVKLNAVLDNAVIDPSENGKLFRVANGKIEYVETHDVNIEFDDKSTDVWQVIK